MPIVKVPVAHKFGVVSNDEHQKLQRRLLAKYLAKFLKPKKKEHKNPLELTEEFIEDFNESLKTEKKENLIELARKMLARCKRRLGLSTLGCGKHVDLPLAWTEAIMLAQCKGNISEEALEILTISLDHAPVVADHIAVLFFLAESILYKLCHDAVQKPYLFSCEIKLSKLGFLVILRLLLLRFFGGQIYSAEAKSRLHVGLKALAACETCYQIYPNILFMIHFILKAGETICETVVFSDSSLATEADLEERHDETFPDTTPVSPGKTVELNPQQKQLKIKQFLWHILLLWVCVHNSCSEINQVLSHVLLYKEQINETNWLESILGLMVLGETAKLSMSCLRVLMDLMRDFISNCVPLQKQQKNCKKDACWPWQVGYIYTIILREICLHGINADLRKTAFLGFCDCVNELKDDKELRGTSFIDILCYYPSTDDSDNPFWVIRYGVIYNLVILQSELSGDPNWEGLRNAVWKTLQKQKEIEKDTRILTAAKVAEVEAQGLTDWFPVSKDESISHPRDLGSTQYIGWRVATSMCHHFLPPIGTDIRLPCPPVQKKSPRTPQQKSELTSKETKAKRLSLREKHLQAGVPKYPYPDYFTRIDMELRKIVENQWEEEFQLRIQLEEKLIELELQEKKELEEERLKQIMKWRLEKLHKTTKPYELPFQHEKEAVEEGKLNKASSSAQMHGSQMSPTWSLTSSKPAPYWQVCLTKPNTSF